MNTTVSLYRHLIVPCLVLSLSVVNVYPAAVAWSAGVESKPGGKVTVKDCCRPNSGARCCGTSCCEVSAPRQQQEPAPMKSASERSQSIVLALAGGTSGLHAAAAGHSVSGGFTTGWTPGDSTLQAQHVRLQI